MSLSQRTISFQLLLMSLFFVLLSGLAGFYIIRDPNGKEANFELPSSEFDYPLLLQNKQVEESGGLHESLNNTEVKLVESTGIMCVNGKVKYFFCA